VGLLPRRPDGAADLAADGRGESADEQLSRRFEHAKARPAPADRRLDRGGAAVRFEHASNIRKI